MKQFKRIKKGLLGLLVAALVMVNLMGCSVIDIFAISEASNVEIKEVVKPVEEVKVEAVEKYAAVEKEEVNYHEIKDKVPDTVKEEPVKPKANSIADGKDIKEKIKIACDIHGVPYDIAMAIARLETGHFKSYAFREKNNPGGLSRNEVPMSFDTIDDGVEAFVGNLGRNYISIGLDTPEKIGKKYCPVNPNWANLVRSLMEEYD